MHALFVTYGLNGTTPCQHAELSQALAPAFAAVPGLVSRTPLENPTAGRYGAFYVFETKGEFDRFVASELYGVTDGAPELPSLAASDYSIPNGAGRATDQVQSFLSASRHRVPHKSKFRSEVDVDAEQDAMPTAEEKRS